MDNNGEFIPLHLDRINPSIPNKLKDVWLACHYSKKLGKKQIIDANISESVGIIAEFSLAAKPSLRVCGSLLAGVARLYARKVEYFQTNCGEVLERMQRATSEKHFQRVVNTQSKFFDGKSQVKKSICDSFGPLHESSWDFGEVREMEDDQLFIAIRKQLDRCPQEVTEVAALPRSQTRFKVSQGSTITRSCSDDEIGTFLQNDQEDEDVFQASFRRPIEVEPAIYLEKPQEIERLRAGGLDESPMNVQMVTTAGRRLSMADSIATSTRTDLSDEIQIASTPQSFVFSDSPLLNLEDTYNKEIETDIALIVVNSNETESEVTKMVANLKSPEVTVKLKLRGGGKSTGYCIDDMTTLSDRKLEKWQDSSDPLVVSQKNCWVQPGGEFSNKTRINHVNLFCSLNHREPLEVFAVKSFNRLANRLDSRLRVFRSLHNEVQQKFTFLPTSSAIVQEENIDDSPDEVTNCINFYGGTETPNVSPKIVSSRVMGTPVPSINNTLLEALHGREGRKWIEYEMDRTPLKTPFGRYKPSQSATNTIDVDKWELECRTPPPNAVSELSSDRHPIDAGLTENLTDSGISGVKRRLSARARTDLQKEVGFSRRTVRILDFLCTRVSEGHSLSEAAPTTTFPNVADPEFTNESASIQFDLLVSGQGRNVVAAVLFEILALKSRNFVRFTKARNLEEISVVLCEKCFS